MIHLIRHAYEYISHLYIHKYVSYIDYGNGMGQQIPE